MENFRLGLVRIQDATENSILIKDKLQFCVSKVKLATVLCPIAPLNVR